MQFPAGCDGLHGEIFPGIAGNHIDLVSSSAFISMSETRRVRVTHVPG